MLVEFIQKVHVLSCAVISYLFVPASLFLSGQADHLMRVRLSPLALPAALLSIIRSAGSGPDTYAPLCPALPLAGAPCFFGRQLGELCQQIRDLIA